MADMTKAEMQALLDEMKAVNEEYKKEAEGLRTYVMQLEPSIQQYAEKRYRLMRVASRVPCAGNLYYRLFDSKTYTKFKKTWNK